MPKQQAQRKGKTKHYRDSTVFLTKFQFLKIVEDMQNKNSVPPKRENGIFKQIIFI
jgi:hypothetical protein